MISNVEPRDTAPERQEPTLRMLSREPAFAYSGVRPYVAALTDTGNVRRRNEDQFLVATLQPSLCVLDASLGTAAPRIDGRGSLLLAVADGVGGVPGGDVASAVAMDTVAECFLTLVPTLSAELSENRDALSASFHAALVSGQARLRTIAARKGLDTRLGTTLTVAYVTWPELWILHIGDSRAYLCRDQQLTHLTRDQTAAQELLEAGMLRPSAAEKSPLRHMLTSAVGGGTDDFQLDVQHMTLAKGDTVMLCTDGLYDELSDGAICERLRTLSDGARPEQVVHELIGQAKAAGGRDNVTTVVATFQ